MSNQKIYNNLIIQAEKLRRHNRQGSFKTRERYFDALKRFCHFLANEYRLEKLANVAPKHFIAYSEAMKKRGLSPSTIKTDLAAIRFFHDQIPNPRHQLPNNSELSLMRRQFGKVDRTWSNREFNLMLLKCMELKRPDFEACIAIARYAGFRIHEVMKIDTATARSALKNDFITIKGKGGKVRDVSINHTIHVVLKNALERTPQGEKLFVPKDKHTHEVIKELQTFIATHRKSVQDEGSTRPMTFHGLRHTCAAEWYKRLVEEGQSEYQARLQVSKWLGHERDDVTNIYLASIEKDADD